MLCLYSMCLLFVAVHSGTGSDYDTWSDAKPPAQPPQNVDALLDDYLMNEKSLWNIIRSSGGNQDRAIHEIYEAHKKYMGKNFGEIGILRTVAKELSTANRTIIDNVAYVNTTFDQGHALLKHRWHDRMPMYTSDVIRTLPFATSETKRAILDQGFWNAVLNASQFCRKHTAYILAETQVLNEVYKELVATLLKSYMTMQFSFMISTTKGVENYQSEADRLRNIFKVDVTLIQDTAKKLFANPRLGREMWACDPNDFTSESSYVEVTRFFQGYIANEINLNSRGDCQLSCSEYYYTWHFNCRQGTYCSEREVDRKQSVCHGSVQNCVSIESDMTVCSAHANSPRRYEYVKYNNGRLLGVERYCPGKVSVKSWWDWFYKCDNCFCYCDDSGIQGTRSDSDRYFSLRAAVSDVTENKVVTGVAITKINRVIQLQIAQRQLLPYGLVNTTNDVHDGDAQWKTSQQFNIDDEYVEEEKDYTALSWANRSIALVSAIIEDNQHVVTGVRFRRAHNHLRLEVRATRFDFETGHLKDPGKSIWVGNNARLREVKIHRPDVPTKSRVKSTIFPENNNFVQFQPTDFDKDAAQTTIPFLDATRVEAISPLAGVGLYYKTTYGYGGFIGPKLIVFDFSKYITPPSFI